MERETSIREGDVMGYKARSERSGGFDFRIMEVRLRKKNAAPGTKEELRLMTVDSHWETLRFVQEHMEEFVGNIVRLKRVEAGAAKGFATGTGNGFGAGAAKGINESAALFERNLEPLLSTLAAAKGEGVMDKLSSGLKKALLLMVMERYQSDRDLACKVLGISREKLEKELVLCGVSR
jgi:DNA-binding protein Fis